MDWTIAIIIVIPGVFMALSASDWLIDYAFFVLAFNRGLRRIIDYYFGHVFNPFSPISLTPLILTGLLFVPFCLRSGRLSPRVRTIFVLLIVAVGYAFIIGFLRNRMAAVFTLSEYFAPFGMMGFAATSRAPRKVVDRWMKSAGWTAVGIALYGWYQYLHPPVWDAFWLQESGMIGYLGIPEPTKIAVFSTLAERGPCASFLAWAVIPMIVAGRWRNWTGWISIVLVLSVIPLTYVRTALIGVALVVTIHPLVNRGRGLWSVITCVVLAIAGFYYGLDRIPGEGQISERYGTLTSITNDSSFQGRLEIAHYGFRLALSNPIGIGLGSSGVAGRINSGTADTDISVMDNGYFALALDFGWLGTLLFWTAIWLIWNEMSRRFHKGIRDEFLALGRSILLSLLVLNYVVNVFDGPSLFWVIFGFALSPRFDPEMRRRRTVKDDSDADSVPPALAAR